MAVDAGHSPTCYGVQNFEELVLRKSVSLLVALIVGGAPAAIAEEEKRSGAPVLLKYGKGINEEEVHSVVRGLNQKGCPVRLSDDHRPRRVSVYVLGKNASFKSPLAALGWASGSCSSVSVWPVTFWVGPGISEADVASVVRGVEERGCPVTVKEDFVPGTITVKVRNSAWGFDEPIDAAGMALDLCLE